jgi:hypothetical protein
MWNSVGTTAMGPKDSVFAVVDPELRVIGTKGLRVVDAGVMPSIPGGGTLAPTIMIAEKAAEMIGNYWSHHSPEEVHKEKEEGLLQDLQDMQEIKVVELKKEVPLGLTTSTSTSTKKPEVVRVEPKVQFKTQAGNQLSELMKTLKDQSQSTPSFKPFPGLGAKIPSKAGGVNPGVTVKNPFLPVTEKTKIETSKWNPLLAKLNFFRTSTAPPKTLLRTTIPTVLTSTMTPATTTSPMTTTGRYTTGQYSVEPAKFEVAFELDNLTVTTYRPDLSLLDNPSEQEEQQQTVQFVQDKSSSSTTEYYDDSLLYFLEQDSDKNTADGQNSGGKMENSFIQSLLLHSNTNVQQQHQQPQQQQQSKFQPAVRRQFL